MFQSFKKRNTWDLIWQLFRTDFKLKYNDSVLGFIWVLVKPFALFMIIYTVISTVFNPGSVIPNYPLYLLLGNMYLSYWIEGSTHGMESLLSRASVITKVNFPRYIVLLSSTLLSSVNFLINLLVFIIIAAFNHLNPSPLQILWFIFCTFCLYSLITVISMFTSILFVKFRDLKQIWELFNQLIFWATPIVYSADTLIKKSALFDLLLTKLNPISVFLLSGRSAILYNDIDYKKSVFIWFIVIIIGGIIGYIYYKKSIKRIAEFF